MKLELVCEGQTCHEIDKDELANRFSGAIRSFRDRVTWARVKLVDVRDETGAWAKRCVVQMRLRQRPQVVFAVTERVAQLAVERAVKRVQRVLERRFARPQTLPLPA